MRRLVVILAACVLALIPMVVLAQGSDPDDEGFLLRISGDVVVPEGEFIDTVVVIDGNVRVDGTVKVLVTISGDATIGGTVEDDIVVVDGRLVLEDQSTVNDVTLAESEIEQAPGATVRGSIDRNASWNVDIGFGILPGILLWIALTIFAIVAALIFAAIGGRQLSTAARMITDEVGPTILAAVILWLAVPFVIIAIFLTLIGIPIAIGIILFVLPALWFLGYIVTATRIGAAITRKPLGVVGPQHPYLAAFVGVVILQAVGLIPVVGWLLGWLAGLLGGGALALLGWRAIRNQPPSVIPPVAPVAPGPTPTASQPLQ